MDLGNTLGMRFGLLRTRSLDHYLHHHSHLIVTCFNLTFLGRVVRRCHTLPHLYPSLFLPFFCFIHSSVSYPFQSSSTLIDHRLTSQATCLLVHFTYHFTLFIRMLVESPCSHDPLIFDIARTRVWQYLLGIWAFVSHHVFHLSPLAYITVRVVRPP